MFFHRTYKRRYIFKNLKQFFRDIKWGFQRFKRGYCDMDWWNIDAWFFRNLEGLLSNLAKYSISYPADCESHEAWVKELNSIIVKLHLFNSSDGITNAYELGQEVLEWFSRRCFDLWD